MPRDLLGPELCTAIMRVGSRLASIFDLEMGGYGLTQAQFRTLLAIRQHGQIRPGQLADELMLDRASISLLTSKMVSAGWLERLPDNRRSFKLQLTPAGEEQFQSALQPAIDLSNRTIAGLPRQQAEAVLEALRQLEEQLRITRR
jgi:DNA-binding MarR family transcriptional regulator